MNYFWLDASALAKRYVVEIGTPVMNYLFAGVPLQQVICLLEGVGEVISIFVRRMNAGAITATSFNQIKQDFRLEVSHCADVEKIYPTPSQIISSWGFIETYSLNSTDAVILRCAIDKTIELRAGGHDLILVSADGRLLKAAQAEGLLTFNPETDSQTTLDSLIV